MKNIIVIPLYILFIIINYILRFIYKYESLSESNKSHIKKMLSLLLKNIQHVNKKDLRVIIKQNRFTNNMVYILNYTHNDKKLILKKSLNTYVLFYKGKVIRFTENNKHVFNLEWKKLNAEPVSYFEA